MITPFGRVSFPQVYQPRAIDDGQKLKYSLTLIFYPEDMSAEQKKLLAAMKVAANEAAQERFGVNLDEKYNGKLLNSPFKKADEDSKYYEPGTLFVRLGSIRKPGVIDQAKKPITEDSGDFYAGCWAHASYRCFAYETSGNRGVAFGLNNVQKIRDDKPFGQVTTADQDFEVIEPIGASVGDDLDDF